MHIYFYHWTNDKSIDTLPGFTNDLKNSYFFIVYIDYISYFGNDLFL